MRIKSLEDLHHLEMECPLCGDGVQALLKSLTIEGGGDEPPMVTVSYYAPDMDEHADTRHAGRLLPADER